MPQPILLSARGSDRATAYALSNKIVRQDGVRHPGTRLFVGWLEAPDRPGLPSRATLGTCSAHDGQLLASMTLGETTDNHCGPALALDGHGRMHAVIGAHGQVGAQGAGAFQYRWSDRPADPDAWSDPERLAPADTYLSMVVDAAGTLHLAHRASALSSGERWELLYRRKPAGGGWEPPRALVVSPVPGCCHFGQSLALGPCGRLHLLFQFHHGPTGRAVDCQTVAIAHLYSPDGGDHWLCSEHALNVLPAEMDELTPIRFAPQGGLSISNVVIDAAERPWFVAADPGTPSGLVWHLDGDGWEATGLPPWLPPDRRHASLRNGSLTRDPDGRLHLAVPAAVDGRTTGFFDPSLEVYHLQLSASGDLLTAKQTSLTLPTAAHWLPAIEWWDWLRPTVACADGPWLAYTERLNAGGIGEDNANALHTNVWLARLDR